MYSSDLDTIWKVLGAFAIFGVFIAIVLFLTIPPTAFAWLYSQTTTTPLTTSLVLLAALCWVLAWGMIGAMLLVIEKKERARWR